MRPFPVLLAFCAVLAGCVSSGPGTETASSPAGAPAAMAELAASLVDLPCETPEVGKETSANLRVLAYAPLDEPAKVDHAEMAWTVREGTTYLAAARIGQGGFDLLDASDPRAPRVVATWEPSSPEYAMDLKFTGDGLTLVVAGSDVIRLVDVRDPAAPALLHEHALEDAGAHLVTVFRVEGEEYLAASKGEGKDVSLFRVVGSPEARSLEKVASPLLTPLGDAPRSLLEPLRSHDAWFEEDPETGTPLLWIANVWWGIVALDVSDPADPEVVARIPNLDPWQGYVHSVQVAHLDARRLVVATQEYGLGALKVYDATDLAAPRLVGVWSLDLPTKALHNLQVVGSHAIVAHFQDGLSVFDLSGLPADGPAPARLSPVARLAPHEAPPPYVPATYVQPYFGPRDVVVKDGVLWVTEATGGVRAVAFGCLAVGDPALSSSG